MSRVGCLRYACFDATAVTRKRRSGVWGAAEMPAIGFLKESVRFQAENHLDAKFMIGAVGICESGKTLTARSAERGRRADVMGRRDAVCRSATYAPHSRPDSCADPERRRYR